MLLSDLIADGPQGAGAVEIRGLTADSRAVRPGYLFAAIRGGKMDGADYVEDAVARGAVALLADHDVARGHDLPLIIDGNPRRRLALMAQRFFAVQPRFIAAVTGTSGKTSVAEFLRQMWQGSGRKAATLGTLGVVGDGVGAPLPHTTPDPVTLHKALAAIAARGIDHLALEASSHGLDQYRLDGVTVAAAAYTNLSQDHFDYHAGPADYLAAKMRLFAHVLRDGGTAVLNIDAPEFPSLEAVCRARGLTILTYGAQAGDLRLVETHATAAGQTLSLDILGKAHVIDFPLAGGFQAINGLCALGLALASGVDVDRGLDVLGRLVGVRGRLEPVARLANGAVIYVDYAHKPGALETVLATLRPHVAGRLAVVFGCGGERDRAKRPIMGRIAAQGADRVIVTDDNPRHEDARTIRAEALAGCPGAEEIGDRRAAIIAAVGGLRAGDGLVIAGKGHEAGQTIGDETVPFDDAEVAGAAVEALERKTS